MKDFNSLEELEEYLNKMEKEIKSIKESIGKQKKFFKGKKPIEGDSYCYIDEFMQVSNDLWLDGEVDISRFSVGNCFETVGKAEFEIERLKVIAELKKYSKIFNPDENNFCICYSYDEDKLAIYLEPNDEPDMGTYFFANKEIAKKAINEVGKERIKKYMLGMEV